MTVGSPRSYYKKFNFIVRIDGFSYFGFATCSELGHEVDVVSHREGGALLPDQTPGLVTVPNITLTRGATKDQEMHEWAKEVVDFSKNAGLVDPKYARDIDITQQDRDGKAIKRWTAKECWPRKYVAGDWDGNASEVVIEQMELVVGSGYE